MIEKEFGINPDTQEEIGNKFGLEVSNIRVMANGVIDKLRKETEDRFRLVKDAMKRLAADNESLYTKHEEVVRQAKVEIQKMRENEKMEIEQAYFEKFDEERRDFDAKVNELEEKFEREGGKSYSKKNSSAAQLKEFLNLAKGKKEDVVEEKIMDEQVHSRVESENIAMLRQQILDLKKEMLNYKYLHGVAEKDYERVHDTLKAYASDIAFLKEANDQLRIESDNFEKQIDDYRKANANSASFVERLSTENEALKIYVEKIIKGLPQSRRGLIEKQSPLNIINMQTNRAKYELNSNYLKMSVSLFRDNQVSAATITELSGIDKELIK